MSILLLRIALLTSYDKLHSLLTPSSCYLWFVNWTEKETCSTAGGSCNTFPLGWNLNQRIKKGEKKDKLIYACVYSSLKSTGCCERPVQNCSNCSQASQKHSLSVLLDVPVRSLHVCLVFSPLILVSVLLCALLKQGLSIPCEGKHRTQVSELDYPLLP